MPYQQICQTLAMPLASVRRWRNRVRLGRPLVGVPGPRKVSPVDLAAIQQAVAGLGHRPHRTFGTPALYRKYQWQISRRSLQAMVNSTRQDLVQQERAELTRLEWLAPNLAWAMDDTHFGYDEHGCGQYLHTMQDLATTYKFEPLAGEVLTGQAIAGHLRATGLRHGFPLFLKEDNGSNQRSIEVRAVMEEFGVLPLPSPPEYPKYNGAEEHGNGEIKNRMRERLHPQTVCPSVLLQTCADSSVHDLNHIQRDKLRGKIACYVYHGRPGRAPVNHRERRSVYEWLLDKQNDILNHMGALEKRLTAWAADAAWRKAALMWLWMNKMIEVKQNGKVLPYLTWESAH